MREMEPHSSRSCLLADRKRSTKHRPASAVPCARLPSTNVLWFSSWTVQMTFLRGSAPSRSDAIALVRIEHFAPCSRYRFVFIRSRYQSFPFHYFRTVPCYSTAIISRPEIATTGAVPNCVPGGNSEMGPRGLPGAQRKTDNAPPTVSGGIWNKWPQGRLLAKRNRACLESPSVRFGNTERRAGRKRGASQEAGSCSVGVPKEFPFFTVARSAVLRLLHRARGWCSQPRLSLYSNGIPIFQEGLTGARLVGSIRSSIDHRVST